MRSIKHVIFGINKWLRKSTIIMHILCVRNAFNNKIDLIFKIEFFMLNMMLFSEWDARCKLQSIISNLKLLNLVAFHWRFLQSRKAYLFTARYTIESCNSAQSNSGYLRSTQSAQYSHAEMERGRKKSNTVPLPIISCWRKKQSSASREY